MRRGAPGSIYHFSVLSDVTIAEIVRRIAQLQGRSFDEVAEITAERLGQDARYTLDCTKAQRELGWVPQIPFDEGLREVMTWIDGAWETMAQEPLVYVHKT